MLCPVCDTEMIIQELQQVEVDHCLSCHGIWFDHGELELLLQQDDPAATRDPGFIPAQTKERARRCPVCRKRMDKVHAGASDNSVLIDHCPGNHGLWFDAGELHQLIESSTNQAHQKLVGLLREMFAAKGIRHQAAGDNNKV